MRRYLRVVWISLVKKISFQYFLKHKISLYSKSFGKAVPQWMFHNGLPLFLPGTLCMANTSDASKSMLTVSFRILQNSTEIGTEVLMFALLPISETNIFFSAKIAGCFWLTTAASAMCWHCFTFCSSSLGMLYLKWKYNEKYSLYILTEWPIWSTKDTQCTQYM